VGQRLFGTDGIRGTTEISGADARLLVLTPELALRIGQAAGAVAREWYALQSGGSVVVGRDPRISGPMLEMAVTAGLVAQGFTVMQVGVVPTPGVAFLTRQLGASLGVVVSASHNPVTDNGIKFFDRDGYKVSSEWEESVESLVVGPDRTIRATETRLLGNVCSRQDLAQAYVSYLLQSWRPDRDLSGYSVLLDCANGAASRVAPEVFRRMGCQVSVVAGEPDGLNINQTYEYVYPTRFAKQVTEAGADVGIAFDGDADRVILVDERGGTVDGDTIIGILARYLQSRSALPGDFVVTTQMSNFGLHDSLKDAGIRVVETAVGDRHVMQRMREDGGTLGGERSGHILVFDRGHTTGDGVYTALRVVEAMVNQGHAKLSELAAQVRRYPQFIESMTVPAAKPPLEHLPAAQAVLRGLRDALGGDADVKMRYSGTEDKLRLSVRCHTDSAVESMRSEAQQSLRRIAEIIAAAA